MPHTIYKRGQIWHFRGTVAGRRLRGTTGTTEKALAQRIAAAAEDREWKRHLDGPEAHVTFAQAVIAYQDAEKPMRFVARVAEHWKDTRIRQITSEAIRQSAIKLYPNAGAATRNRQVIVPTAAIINHAARLGWCNPIRVRRFPSVSRTKAIIEPEWAERFAANASPHLGALCIFMFGTGARIGQAVRLTWGDVDLRAQVCRIPASRKNFTEHEAHLPPRVVAALANIGGDRATDELVFGYAERGSVAQPWRNAEKRAGLEHRSPHFCRHGFATLLSRRGFDVSTIARLGGWKDASVVLRSYAHAQEDRTVTTAIFDTKSTRGGKSSAATESKQRRKVK
ncbi:tyrosine-type recombinase/integrase [Cereibacter sphaeroides]|uniref:tyrosine-type recombinase/integrase n=1 Tax=Cereibacter sphaeroides TaxID=1063 RepID=UPI001F27F8D1|nr:tyrosine-type recombinase/integrase [Cereibacter sphaeroides]MCE6952399.1 tyrosine-type recombinase/integrase [Cereibacter sphaeroides]